MIKIGLTGVIGSGKTTAINYFKELQVPVYIADEKAKEIMQNHDNLKEKLKDILGNQAYENDKLNTGYISEKIFNDENLLLKINKLVHPVVKDDFHNWLCSLKSNYSVYESALIFENGDHKDFDIIICIKTPIEIIYERLKSKKNYNKKKIDLILNQQLPQHIKCQRSDYCINNLSIVNLKSEILKVHKKLQR